MLSAEIFTQHAVLITKAFTRLVGTLLFAEVKQCLFSCYI